MFQTSQIHMQHVLIDTTADQIRAMELIRDTVKSLNFSNGNEHVAVFSPDYVSWTANKVIKVTHFYGSSLWQVFEMCIFSSDYR